MNDVLCAIIERTRTDLREAPIAMPEVRAAAEARRRDVEPHRFARAVAGDASVRVIAEVKAKSPSAGAIAPDPDVEAIAGAYRDGGAAAISVVVEPHFFGGSRTWLARAAGASRLPVIMKDFVVAPEQVVRGIAAGADAVLLLASVLDAAKIREFTDVAREFGCDTLVEVHDEAELERAVEAGATLVGVNNRDLRDFSVSLATSERLAASIPEGVTRVAESGIRSVDDVRRLRAAGYHAFLVGESLLREVDRSEAVRRLCA